MAAGFSRFVASGAHPYYIAKAQCVYPAIGRFLGRLRWAYDRRRRVLRAESPEFLLQQDRPA